MRGQSSLTDLRCGFNATLQPASLTLSLTLSLTFILLREDDTISKPFFIEVVSRILRLES